MSMATAAAVIGAGTSLYGAYQQHMNSGGGGSSDPDPFAQYRNQFGSQLSNLFANGQTPSWLTPGAGMNMGMSLAPGAGMADPSMLNFDPAAITNDPAYKFQRRAGMDAINSQAAASGELNSGGAMAGATRYGQDLATSFTNQQLQRNLSRYQALNAGQNQNFAQILGAMGFQNQAQNQQFGQGSQLASLLAMLSGATQSPAAGSNANFNQQQTGYGNIMSSLGMLGRVFGGGSGGFTSGSGTAGSDIWAGGGWGP